MNPTIKALAVWIVMWLLIVAGAYYQIDARMRKRVGEAHERGIQQKQDRAQARRLEWAMREQESRAQLARQGAAVEAQLIARLGGGVAAAFKHPDYSLTDAMQRGAEACAPQESLVKVDVDRFTEFTVSIARESALSTNEMVEFVRCFLPWAAEFTHAIRFSSGDSVIAELDRADIELVEDWARAPVERVAMLLPREVEVAAEAPVAERVDRDRKVARLAESDPELVEKLARAQEGFFEAARAADEQLREAISLSDEAVNVGSDRRAANFLQRQKDLRSAVEQAKAAREFWEKPAKAWRTSLEKTGASVEAIDVLAESFGDLLRHNDAKAAEALNALDAKIESARFFLRTLEDQIRGSAGEANAFTSEDAAARVNRALEQLRTDSRALEVALREWFDARQGK